MSQSPNDIFEQVAELTELYLRDEITDTQLAELEALVRGDKHAADAMRTVLAQFGTMRVVFSEQRQFANRIGEVKRDEYLKLLQTLGPSEEPEPVHLVGRVESKRPLWQHWQFAIPTAIAALIAIAIILIVTMAGNTPQPTTPGLAEYTPPKPVESAPPIKRDQPVATLTATHNAIWSGGPTSAGLQAGDKLHASDRLTLAAGFAEITTARGAIAVLEAPATIELIDSPNALWLHSGKLVGICETESSKGFLVLTAHMDITDIGTRFGTEVVAGEGTEVHVIQGEVVLSPAGLAGSDDSTHLYAGESANSTVHDRRIVPIEHAPDRFGNLLPKRNLIAGTGRGLEAGQVDPNWQLIAIDGKAIDEPQAIKVATTSNVYNRVFDNDPSTSQWLAWDMDVSASQSNRPAYSVQATIDLPATFNEFGKRLILRYMADNELRSVRVNGQRIALPHTELDEPYSRYFEAAISAYLVPGTNTLVFEVINHGSTQVGNRAGLRMALYLEHPAWAEGTP